MPQDDQLPIQPPAPSAPLPLPAGGRSIVIDVMRGFAISLVVFGHTNQGTLHRNWWGASAHTGAVLNSAIYSTHMPAFFFVSGIFLVTSLVKRGSRHFVVNKLQTILYPYVVWSVIIFAGNHAFHRFTVQPLWTMSDYFNYLFTGNQSWFLPTIFLALMLAMLLHKIKPPLLFVLSAAAGVLWHPFGIGDIDNAVHYLPFLVLGMWMGLRFDLVERVPRAAAALLTLLLLAAVWRLAGYDPPGSRLLYLPAGALGILALLLLARSLGQGWAARRLAWIGEASFGIFLISAYPQGGGRELVLRLFHSTSPLLQLTIPTLLAILIPVWIYQHRVRLHIGWLFVWPAPRKRAERPSTA